MKIDKERVLLLIFAVAVIMNAAISAKLVGGETEPATTAGTGTENRADEANAVAGSVEDGDAGNDAADVSAQAGPPASGESGAGGEASTGQATEPSDRSPSGESSGGSDDGQAVEADSATAAEAGDPIKIGTLMAGNFPIPYGAFADGPAAYVRAVNERGGVNGHPLELVIREANFSPSRGTTECRKLIEQDKVFAVVGPAPIFGAGDCYRLLAEAGIPVIGADGVNLESYRYANSFNLAIDVWNAGRGVGYFAYEAGARNCAIIYIDGSREMSDYKDGFEAEFTERGGNSTAYSAPMDQADFNPIILRIRSQSPPVDCLVFGHAPDASLRILQAMDRQDFTVDYPVFGYENHDERVTRNAARYPDQVKGAIMPVQVHMPEQSDQYPVVKEYVEQIRRYFPDSELSTWQQMSWLATKTFVDTLERVGPSPTRQGLVQELRRTSRLNTGMFPDEISWEGDGPTVPQRSLGLLTYDVEDRKWDPVPNSWSSDFWVRELPN